MFFHADFKAWWFQSIDSDWCGWPPVMISSWLSWCLWFSHSFRVLHRLEKGWEPKALRFIFLWLMCNQDWTTALGSSCFPFVSVLSLPTCYDIPTRIQADPAHLMVAIQNFWWMICTNTIQLGLRGADMKEGQVRQQLLTQCLCQCPRRVYNHL